MTLSILFYVILWLALLPVLYINILVFRMAKRETMILSWELKVDSICNMLSTIHHLFLSGTLSFGFRASVIWGEWYYYVSKMIISFDVLRNLTMTFSIGVYRYIFIMHGALMSAKRKKRIKRTLFATKALLLVLFTSKFVIFSGKGKFWSSVCNKGEPGLTANHEFYLGWFPAEMFYTEPPGQHAIITIFGLVEHGALAVSLKVFCIIVDLLILVSILNVTEGVLHYRIGTFLKK